MGGNIDGKGTIFTSVDVTDIVYYKTLENCINGDSVFKVLTGKYIIMCY